MRRLFILVLLIASAVTLRAASYEARSPQHAVALDVVSLGEGFTRYDLKISDMVTGAVLATPQLTSKLGQPAETTTDVRDLHIRVRVAGGTRLMARIEFVQGDDIIDTIESYWSIGPQKRITTAPDGLLGVGGDVKAPVVINRVEPIYPEEARKARIMGIVIVKAVISRDGVVKDVQVLKPLPFGLDQAAVDAVKQWTFKPATLDGKPVDVFFNLTINFKLATPPPPPPPG
ncbi:MAG TPA: energy transducer TonB [Thermoanaerobaculia bacterium]|jgi:TonB family protein|nr:energy transducer TonB [Thermoanaerobaculia bacterium]